MICPILSIFRNILFDVEIRLENYMIERKVYEFG